MAHRLARSRCRPQSGQRFVAGGKDYELMGRLGDGAAGLVRKAHLLDGDDIVAVKFLAPDPKYIDTAVFDDVARRFKREGERGAHLRHENLVTILAYSDNEKGSAFRTRTPSNPFIVMEYLEAKTLESYIRSTSPSERGMFSITEPRLSIAVQIALALEHLKSQRLVHRDVKPANIFLKRRGTSRWSAKLGDFGVMKWGDYHAALASGTLTVVAQKGLGTLKYMSPEQAIRPVDVTIKSDIWSFGITLFELFTGQILASAHHVYELQAARRAQGTTTSRYNSLRVRLSHEERGQGLADLILDMFLAADGRPTIDKLRGRLEFEYARRFGPE